MRFILLLLYFFIWFSPISYAQTAYQVGEKLRYVGSFYSSGAWSDIAELRLEIHPASKAEVLKLVGTAQTYTSWDNYFKIRDVYQSWIEKSTGKPLVFNRSIQEGNFKMELKYIFKYKTQQIESTVSKQNKPEQKKIIKNSAIVYDMLSALYYVRNLNFKSLKVNDQKKIQLIIDEKMEVLVLTYLGIEQIPVEGKGKVSCYKIQMKLENQKIIKNNPNNMFWLSADAKKVPMRIKAEIPAGSIQIRLIP
jgi:hypothetical protein